MRTLFARTLLALWLWVLCTVSGAQPAPPLGESARNAVGTGFFVSAEGHLVTANHVLKGRNFVFVRLQTGGRWRLAQVIRASADDDLALLKINTSSTPLPLARWRGVPIGLEVYVLGFPQPSMQGNGLKITAGIVNGEFTEGRRSRLFQLSAEIQKGNSGGPVLSPDGLVVGVVQSKLDAMSIANKTNDLPQNVNFAAKSEVLERFLLDAGLQPEVRLIDLNVMRRPYQLLRDNLGGIAMVLSTDDMLPAKAMETADR